MEGIKTGRRWEGLRVIRFGDSEDVAAGWKATGRGPSEGVSADVGGWEIEG